jgi:hypothetical protein
MAAAGSSLALVMNVHFEMICHLKKFLSAGFAAGLVVLSASAQPVPPLYFEANHGQADNSMQFLAQERDSQFLISPHAAQIVLHKTGGESATVRMQFVGANPQAQIHGDAELPGRVNYLVGDPAQWHSDVPTFARVKVSEIYPGVDAIYYGNQRQLEYDLTVAPGADPKVIAIRFDGLEKISIGADGELILTLPGGEIRQPRPVIYQTTDGARKAISGGYKILDAHTVAFAIGSYKHRLPLVIDPVLGYSTYFGGNYGETAWAVALDNSSNIYVAGQTFSTRFTNGVPFSFSTPGAFQTNYGGGSFTGDAFVAKLDKTGTNLIYLTYLGGSGDDVAYGLAVDANGDAYVTGFTDSTNFPVTNSIPGLKGVPGLSTNISGKLDSKLGTYPIDAFVAELNPGGSNLVYSTYLGGSSLDLGISIAVDSNGNAYVTGETASTNFPTTNAIQSHLRSANSVYYGNLFVTEIAANGTGVLASTYFGGTNYDEGESIAVDAGGFVYVAGFTSSTNFPATNYIHQIINSNLYDGHFLNGMTNYTVANFNLDAFVIKFTPGCTNLVYATLLGSTNMDMAFGIAADGAGDAFVVGQTASLFFPNTARNVIRSGLTNNFIYGYTLTTNAFLTEITNGATAGIAYSVLFGGSNLDAGYKVALDAADDAFVVGYSTSTNFPTTNTFGSLRATNSGGSDAFVTVFNSNATAVVYSGLLGGSTNDYGYGIAVDAAGSAYVVGQTSSTNFPTFNARQTALNGTNDAFIAKILQLSPTPALAATLSGTNVLVSWPPVGEENPTFIKLESNTNLLTTNWIASPQTPVFTNGAYYFYFDPTNRQQFFRLHQY